MKSLILCGSLTPGADSTPLAVSIILAPEISTALFRFSTVKPPASIQGLGKLHALQVFRTGNLQNLHDGYAEGLAELRNPAHGFGAMELDDVEGGGLEYGAQECIVRVHENADLPNCGCKTPDDSRRLIRGNAAGTGWIEIQSAISRTLAADEPRRFGRSSRHPCPNEAR